jgi:hypothetical protein
MGGPEFIDDHRCLRVVRTELPHYLLRRIMRLARLID